MKIGILVLLLWGVLSNAIADDRVLQLNQSLQAEFDLNIELLSWLVVHSKKDSTQSRKHWESLGGVPWKLKKLEDLGYVYLVVREHPDRNNQIGYNTWPTEKAFPILYFLKEAYSYSEESAISGARWLMGSYKVTYMTPSLKTKLEGQ